ncbi:Phosphotransferase KptA/Tpt1 [Syntrophobacter sp. SbD1]|nr:Phosphotransferase KptA/Tpt1 [Syntrophobacter sp. SbD1]
MLKHQPKTLTKTLDYVARRSPGEHGLFWDPDGTMPWKEFYWALQQDISLRFVRESTIRELTLLGMELPFALDGNLLRLRPEFGPPVYPVASEVPERLYFGLKPKNLVHTHNIGLKSARRRFVTLCAERELALRIAVRTEEDPILIEILAREAHESGLSFLVAGQDFYLVESVPVEFILFPKLRQDPADRLAASLKKKVQPSPAIAPGSFIVQPHHLQAPGAGAKQSGKGAKKDTKGGWKKEGRKERRKREI